MLEWDDVRLAARACRAAAVAEAGGSTAPDRVVDAAMRLAGLRLVATDRLAPGQSGLLRRGGGMVYVAERLTAARRLEAAAHELGHFHLHTDPSLEARGKADAGSDAVAYGGSGYSWREPVETAADVFAREFLCPLDDPLDVRRAGSTLEGYARAQGLPRELVAAQALRTLLAAPCAPDPAGAEGTQADPDQARALLARDDAILVEGAPGTGKTFLASARILRLLEAGAPPSSIAAFTHSESAARRLRAAVGRRRPGDAAQIWSGTFRSLALQILQAHHGATGRSRAFKVLDEVGLAETLAAGGWAPAEGRRPAGGWPAKRLLEAAREIAKSKARCETGRARDAPRQAAYEALLLRADAYAAGDLTPSAVALLLVDDAIAAGYRNRFRHMVVDDLHDACAIDVALLGAVRGGGTTMFALGDAGSCTDVFRGADPTTTDVFAARFEAVRIRLAVDHRAPRPAGRSSGMARLTTPGRRSRVCGGAPRVGVAATRAGEAAMIAEEARRLAAKGVAIGDQAVLARTHTVLEPLARALVSFGLPVRYAGDFPDRQEVRDLLALCAIIGGADGDGEHLARILALPAYGVRRADALAAHRSHVARGACASKALAAAAIGKAAGGGLVKLADELRGFDRATAVGRLLECWLFDRSGYLSSLDGPDGASARASVYHLLTLCAEQEAQGDRDHSSLEKRVRRISSINQDTDFAKTAYDATRSDGILVMTINAAKGLEFGAVHVAGASSLHMPRPAKAGAPPDDRLRLQEEALFEVAATRARRHLRVTYATRYGSRTASPSIFLEGL